MKFIKSIFKQLKKINLKINRDHHGYLINKYVKSFQFIDNL